MGETSHPGNSSPEIAPYGGWSSPITPTLAARAAAAPDFPCIVDARLYWQETRPADNGSTVIVQAQADGSVRDLLTAPWSARSKVHEYGGLSWLVTGSSLFFVDADDQRLYRLDFDPASNDVPTSRPVPLTPATGNWRFADLCQDPARRRLLAVAEQHLDGSPEPRNSLVAIGVEGGVEPLVAGADFYACPRLSPDGKEICWLAWQHPHMPWDGTELHLAAIDADGTVGQSRIVAGGSDESVFQPAWSANGRLHFVSDRSGWWNLYRQEPGGPRALLPMAAEFGLPLWNLGMSTYGFAGSDHSSILCTYRSGAGDRAGRWQLALLDARRGKLQNLATSCTAISSVFASDRGGCFIGAAPDIPPRIYRVDAGGHCSPATATSGACAGNSSLAPWFSSPRPVHFKTGNNDIAHAWYYPPRNPDFQAPAGTLPPLLVLCHGGPTAATGTGLNYKIQFWTSRGFAVIDVDYRGSTGYGRAYREKLAGNWGVSDVEDVIAAARYCVDQGLADPERLLIRGSSAGGFTVLGALTGSSCFRAGASLYGVGDLETLVRDTHKFEARYLDRLVGPYPGAQRRYRERSAIHRVDRLRCPVIFFQGLEDRVVPPEQSEAMVNALRRRGQAVASVLFADEGHGFRRAGNVSRALEAELYFYRRVLGIEDREGLQPVPVDNAGALEKR